MSTTCAMINNRDLQYFDSITLTLDGNDSNDYNCTLSKSQVKKSSFLTDGMIEFDQDSGKIVFDPHAEISANGVFLNALKVIDNVLIYSIPVEDLELENITVQFFKFDHAFDDMCRYVQNVYFNEQYDELAELPMPLFLNDSNDFYNLKELTNQEILFLKQIESFDDINNNTTNNNNNNTINPFDIDMFRMNNLFKISQFLQIQRLHTIIAARHASLMKNMNKNQMTQWLVDIKYSNPNDKKPIVSHCDSDSSNESTNDEENAGECVIDANDLNEYNFVLLHEILSFLPCYDVRTFASISQTLYDIANELHAIQLNIDQMIAILTKRNDATCLSLTLQELLFYQPFLTLPQYQWSNNQNNTYHQLQKMATSSYRYHIVVSYCKKYVYII